MNINVKERSFSISTVKTGFDFGVKVIVFSQALSLFFILLQRFTCFPPRLGLVLVLFVAKRAPKKINVKRECCIHNVLVYKEN